MDTPEQTIPETIQKNLDFTAIEEAVKDNKNEFVYNSINYRVRKPSYKEKQQVYEAQARKFKELVESNAYMFEDNLKSELKKNKNVDLDAFGDKIETLEFEKKKLQLELGELLKNKGSEQDIITIKNRLLDVISEQQITSIRKSRYLEYSIENQLMLFSYDFLTFLVTEKQVEDKWVKAFNNFDEFLNESDGLVSNLTTRTYLLLQNEIK